ncbi:MAG: chemotaxis protein CheW [Desulfuromonadaceae bacterium]
MSNSLKIIAFTLNGLSFGIALELVERVVRMVEITPLPESPPVVLGVINVQGEIVPVLDLRQRFGLTPQSIDPSDQLILTRCGGRRLALRTEGLCRVHECPADTWTRATDILPDLPFLTGVAKAPDGLILIHDLERLLRSDEVLLIQEAFEQECL